MTKQAKEIDAGRGEVYTVENVEPGLFQSVFPSWLAHLSQLHTTRADAWLYINKCIADSEAKAR